MDPTIIGVIIGSLASFLGTFFAQWFTMRREEQQWHRQQEAEEKKQVREEQKAKREAIRDAYHNCIQALSLLIAGKLDNVKLTDEEQLELYREAQKWLTLVALHHRDSYDETGRSRTFLTDLRYFTERSELGTTRPLRDAVIKLAMNDPDLFPDAPIEVPDPSERTITVEIDQEFRRSQFLKGVELPAQYQFAIRIDDLSPEQRRKFWDMYFDKGTNTVGHRFGGLPMPSYNEKANQVILRGGSWEARIDPLRTEPKDIIRAWELDFEKALEEAQSNCEMHSKALDGQT
jgi:hypothetical protein